MKCTKCNGQIYNQNHICPNCGADMKITEQLIERAKNKDSFAISELYERTYDDVYRDLFLYVKGKDEIIYNAISDAYIKAFNKISQLKKPQSFLPWVKTIARHCAIDYLRKEKPNMFNESFDALNEEYDEDGNNYEANLPDDNAVIPIDDLDKKETSRLMQEILDSIPEEQRCVITLFYYDGLSIKEIANELGCSENTVKSRLSYGKKKIEQEVLALEKKGTKLYGLAPVPFFMLLLKSYNSISVSQLPSSIITAIQGSVTGLTVSSAVSTAVSVAGKTTALTASKGIAVKIVAGIVSGVMVVTGGIVGGKILYDNASEKSPQNSAPTSVVTSVSQTETTHSTTTMRIYNELSDSEINYVKTLIRYTVDNQSNDYSQISDSELLDILSLYYRVKADYKNCTDFYPSSDVVEKEDGLKVKVSAKRFQVTAVNAFGKALPNNIQNDETTLENGFYYFSVPIDGRECKLEITNVKYSEDKSKLTVEYVYNGNSTSEEDQTGTATFVRNNNKKYPLRIVSNAFAEEAKNPATTTSTEEIDPMENPFDYYKSDTYEGETVDFGDFTLNVPNTWAYEKEDSGAIVFYEPKTRAQGGTGVLSKIYITDRWTEESTWHNNTLLCEKNGKYYVWDGVTDVQAYVAPGESRPNEKWTEIYFKAYGVIDAVMKNFSLK